MMTKQIVRPTIFQKPRGMYQRGPIWWFQPPMKSGLRGKPISLGTDDYLDAVARVEQIVACPDLAASEGLRHEIAAHIRRKELKKIFTRSTAAGKKVSLLRFAEFLPRRAVIAEIDTAKLQEYYDDVKSRLNLATAHKAIMDVRSFLHDMVAQQKVRTNVAVGVVETEIPHQPRVKFCTREMRDALITNCEDLDLKLVMLLGFHAGLRKNEIIQARREWVRMEGAGFLCLTDTETHQFNRKKKGRTIPMTHELRAHFEEHGCSEPFLVRPDVKQGKSLYRWDLQKPFREYLDAQNAPAWLTPHIMRHTFASLLVMSGCSVYKVAKWMGDLVSTIEDVYGHISPEDEDINVPSKIVTMNGRRISASAVG